MQTITHLVPVVDPVLSVEASPLVPGSKSSYTNITHGMSPHSDSLGGNRSKASLQPHSVCFAGLTITFQWHLYCATDMPCHALSVPHYLQVHRMLTGWAGCRPLWPVKATAISIQPADHSSEPSNRGLTSPSAGALGMCWLMCPLMRLDCRPYVCTCLLWCLLCRGPRWPHRPRF